MCNNVYTVINFYALVILKIGQNEILEKPIVHMSPLFLFMPIMAF